MIDSAWAGAALSSQPAYALVPPTHEYPSVVIDDKEARLNPQKCVEQVLSRAIKAISSCSRLSLASLEVNLTLTRQSLVNSAGLQLHSESSQWVIYQIFLTERDEGPFDQRLEMKRRIHSDLDLEALAFACNEAEEGPRESKLPPSGKITLMLPGSYLQRFFSPLVHHAAAEQQYRCMSKFKTDEPIGQNLDWLNLSLDATLHGGFFSYVFDDEGVPGQRVNIIQDGNFTNHWCPQELSKTLGCAATGVPGNLCIATPPNSLPVSQLPIKFPTLLRVDEFSCLDVSPLSGHFSGEIRTGRLWRKGRLERIRGGAVSGNVFNLLSHTHCCGEETFYGDFLGPSAIVVENVSIAGQ